VVEQNQHAICIREVPLILLHPRARHRPAQLGQERRPDEFAQVHVGNVRELGLQGFGRLRLHPCTGPNNVGERAARVMDRRQDPPGTPSSVVLDDEAGSGGDVGLEVGVDPARVTNGDIDPRFVEPPCQRPALDEEVQFERGLQYFVERANDEFVLTDDYYAHVRRSSRGPVPRPMVMTERPLYAWLLVLMLWGPGAPPAAAQDAAQPRCATCLVITIHQDQTLLLHEKLHGLTVVLREDGRGPLAPLTTALERVRARGGRAGVLIAAPDGTPAERAFALRRRLTEARSRFGPEVLLVLRAPVDPDLAPYLDAVASDDPADVPAGVMFWRVLDVSDAG